MKKALVIISVNIFLILYSAGLTIYGPFGVKNFEASEQYKETLTEIRDEVSSTRELLVDRKQMLENPHVIRYMAQRYGYVLPGDTIVVYPERDLSQIEVEIGAGYRNVPSLDKKQIGYSNQLILGVSFAIAALFFLLSSLLYYMYKRSDRPT
jgi:hypothetical protein